MAPPPYPPGEELVSQEASVPAQTGSPPPGEELGSHEASVLSALVPGASGKQAAAAAEAPCTSLLQPEAASGVHEGRPEEEKGVEEETEEEPATQEAVLSGLPAEDLDTDEEGLGGNPAPPHPLCMVDWQGKSLILEEGVSYVCGRNGVASSTGGACLLTLPPPPALPAGVDPTTDRRINLSRKLAHLRKAPSGTLELEGQGVGLTALSVRRGDEVLTSLFQACPTFTLLPGDQLRISFPPLRARASAVVKVEGQSAKTIALAEEVWGGFTVREGLEAPAPPLSPPRPAPQPVTPFTGAGPSQAKAIPAAAAASSSTEPPLLNICVTVAANLKGSVELTPGMTIAGETWKACSRSQFKSDPHRSLTPLGSPPPPFPRSPRGDRRGAR